MKFVLKIVSLSIGLAFIGTVSAENKIDRITETAIPRSKNLYGLGIGILPKTSGSDEFRTIALPIINANYGDDRYYINALQAGVWLFDYDGKRLRFGLATQARFGWDADDGKLTRGMRDRDFSLDFGPSIRWQTNYGTINAQWGFDIGNASNGQTFDLQYIKNIFRSNEFKLNGSLGITWNNHKLNDYYFGVSPSENTASRPIYNAGSSTEFKVGINGLYSVAKNQYLLFGTSITRLGDEQANSPIVETRMQPFAYLGYSFAY
ncbi:MAG: MipA/OmpV family protein [Methylotenera sp.]